MPCASQNLTAPLGLNAVVDLALCNNPQTREAWANSRIFAARLGTSNAAYFPSASLNGSSSRSWDDFTDGRNQSSAGLTVSYLLYDFGSRSAKHEEAQQLLLASSASQDNVIQTIFLGAVRAFYQVQAALTALDATFESERAAKESFAAAEARYIAGSAALADKLQAQTAYSQVKLSRITADGNLKKAQGILAGILGFNANINVSLELPDTAYIPEDFEGDVAMLIEQAHQNRPNIRAAAAQARAARSSADVALASDRPTLSLSASTNHLFNSGIDSSSSSIALNLSIPLFSGYAPTYRINAAEAQVESRTAQLERLRLQVALDVWNAYQDLKTATQSLRSTADLLDSSTHSERVVSGRYKAGVGSILDLLNAQSTLANARLQRVQSIFNWNISRATLAQSIGNLDTNLLQTLTSGQPAPNNRKKDRP
ncbi:MAG: TolC family protein [Gallionella sp.]